MDRVSTFSQVYQNNLFRGKVSKSGPGSDLDNTEVLRKELVRLLNSKGIRTFIDAPCGDFNYMQKVIPEVLITKYIGVDIVPEMIEANIKKYASDKISFISLDLVNDINLEGDLLLCRDCLVHLSFASTKKLIRNFLNSKINYFLATTFSGPQRKNLDYPDGTGWYPITLTKEPFNFPEPLVLINEQCIEHFPEYSDKCLGLWTREQLQKCGI